MKVLSLFDGISCGQLAFQRAGIPIEKYYASEICDYSMKITKKNFPNTIEIGDIREVNGVDYKDIDIIIGDSPCQSFSFAGNMVGMVTKEKKDITTLEQYLELKKNGFEFEGFSYLFWEYVRVLKEVKPKYFLLENVKMAEKWKKVITDALGVEPIYINSNLVSAQDRKRLYWTNIPNVTLPNDKGIMFRDILEDVPFRELKPFMFGYWGEQRRIDKCSTINRDKAFTVTTSKTHPSQYYLNEDRTMMRNLTITEFERLQTLPDGYTSGVKETSRYKGVGNGWTVDVIAHIFKGLMSV